jgi:alcohol dehydrogenase (cytochrome c)
MTMRNVFAILGLLAAALPGQEPLNQAKLLKPATDSWPMYNGDYSGRRYSTLKQINSTNVTSLTRAWSYRADAATGGIAGIKSTPLVVNGVMYFSAPDHVWAIDARTGKEIWHFAWQSKGGIHLGNRGVGISGNWLYVETPDCNLVSLNIKDGTERWHKSICDLDQMYYASVAPLVVGNHIIVGVSGDDMDIPGYLSAHDPETGELQWRWYAHPEPGSPEAKTWPNTESMLHGGGMTWGAATYDPTLNLLYFGTGNAQPVIAEKARPGDNLYTACLIALNPDTGKMAWYFQATPHESHDWDAIETSVLFDGVINGQPRKLLANASRNGWFFVLDRTNGKNIVSAPFVEANWTKGVDAKGQPIPNPAKDPKIDGALVNPNQGGGANWPPPAFNPDTGLFYLDASNAWSIYYVYDTDDKPAGWGGNDRGGYSESYMTAIDYKTGKAKWSHPWGGGARSGLLTTAGNLVFTTGSSMDVEALDASTGEALWHSVLENSGVTNSPITYELDGKQYLVVAGGSTIYAFTLAPK